MDSYLIAHSSIFDGLVDKLTSAYKQVRIGDPLDSNTLMGPLIDNNAIDDFSNALDRAKKQYFLFRFEDVVNKDWNDYQWD